MPYHEFVTPEDYRLPESPEQGSVGSVTVDTTAEPERPVEKRSLGFGHDYRAKRPRRKHGA